MGIQKFLHTFLIGNSENINHFLVGRKGKEDMGIPQKSWSFLVQKLGIPNFILPFLIIKMEIPNFLDNFQNSQNCLRQKSSLQIPNF